LHLGELTSVVADVVAHHVTFYESRLSAKQTAAMQHCGNDLQGWSRRWRKAAVKEKDRIPCCWMPNKDAI